MEEEAGGRGGKARTFIMGCGYLPPSKAERNLGDRLRVVHMSMVDPSMNHIAIIPYCCLSLSLSLDLSLSLSLAIAALATAAASRYTSPSLYTTLSFLFDLLVGRSQCTAAGRSQWG